MQFRLIPFRRYCLSVAATSANSQITRFAHSGQIEDARRVFDRILGKTITDWNSIVAGYFQNNRPNEARHLFEKMPHRNIVSWNGLISGYVKNRMVKEARKVFDAMPERNVVSWTSMVRGYVEEGLISEAESLFQWMPEKNVVSWTVMLGGLIQDRRIDEARRLYDEMPAKDVVATTNMIAGYCQEGRLCEARQLFDEMPQRNVVSWTTMISGYAHHHKVDIARKLFEVMPEKNEVSWTAMLMGYTHSGRIEEASSLFDSMPVKSLATCNAMIHEFGLGGEIFRAKKVFDSMKIKDDSTWSAMIKVYERKGFELESLKLFSKMQELGMKPNFPSFITVLSVCATLSTLKNGRQTHAQLIKSLFGSDVFISSVLITMYMKCGDLARAKRVFHRFPGKDVVMWNSMISGYAQHGMGEEALKVFQEMCSQNVSADDITFVGVLSACSYTGKVEKGLEIFESMKTNHSIEPTNEHYACMVDLLGRAGRLNEAMNLIKEMKVKPDAIIWGSLMGACRTHMNLDMAEIAAMNLLELEPKNAGPYILLSNIYAGKGRWGNVAEIRKKMRSMKVKKQPGCSWMEVDKKVHMFTVGDKKFHPEHSDIIKMVEKLEMLLREVGYCPDGTFVLHDVDEEEKAQSLRYHSEKLAVAYGVMRVPEGMPIRVMKNLRVCGDCHSAIKLIAKVTNREIILRDANRFHHFKDGFCSCGDYW